MVLADGTFDPLHVGHLAYLEEAGQIGRPLMVRVAPDTDIFEKGRVPYQDQAERLVTLSTIRFVDAVCLTTTLADAVRSYKPTHLVKGIDWEGRLPDDVLTACGEVGTEIVFVHTQRRPSTERLNS